MSSCQQLDFMQQELPLETLEEMADRAAPPKRLNNQGPAAEKLIARGRVAQLALETPGLDYNDPEVIRGNLDASLYGYGKASPDLKAEAELERLKSDLPYIRNNKKAAVTATALEHIGYMIEIERNKNDGQISPEFRQPFKDAVLDKLLSLDKDTSRRIRQLVLHITTRITDTLKAPEGGVITAFEGNDRVAAMFREMLDLSMNVDHLLSLSLRNKRVYKKEKIAALAGDTATLKEIKARVSFLIDRAFDLPLNSMKNLRPLEESANKIKNDLIHNPEQIKNFLKMYPRGLDYTHYLFGFINNFDWDTGIARVSPEEMQQLEQQYNTAMTNLVALHDAGLLQEVYFEVFKIPREFRLKILAEVETFKALNPDIFKKRGK